MKSIRKLLGCFVILVCSLILLPTSILAASIEKVEDWKEAFKGKNVTISGSTIKLTGNVEDNDVYEISGDYIIDLNGYKLTTGEIYVNEGSLTINDSKGKGKIDVRSITVEETAKLTINDAILKTDRQDVEKQLVWEEGKEVEKEYISEVDTEIYNNGNLIFNAGEVEGIFHNTGKANIYGGEFSMFENTGVLNIYDAIINLISSEGTATIKNGTIQSIWNFGSIIIENGTFTNILQEGYAEIKGGVFTAARLSFDLDDGTVGTQDYFSQFNIDAETKITGGEFKTTNLDYVLVIFSNTENFGDPSNISKLLGKGYLPIYKIEDSNGWEIKYKSFEILKDETTLEELMEKLAPKGVLTVNSAKPKTDIALDSLLTTIVNDRDIPKGYDVQIGCGDGDFNPENGAIFISKVTGEYIRKEVKIVYNEPSKSVVKNVSPILNKISEKIGKESDIKTSFLLEDLYLINYLKTSNEVKIDYSLALNFAKDMIKLTNGSNISYKFDYRKGDSGTDLWSFLGGQVVVYYNGIAIDTTEIGLTSSHVLYIPSNTENTDEAIINAALKRIKDYFGTTKGISIKAGGLLETAGNDAYSWNEHKLVDEKTCGTKYYNITINGKTYKFAICKKDELEKPVYITSDIISNITIKSESSELPLDTAITVKEVTNERIEKALGTDVYAAYEISLYSNAQQLKITKLENGKFIVSIPVPEILKDKDITVYYINDKGEKTEHIVTVKDGIASFETDHFSTYALVEKVEIKTPNTYDGIISNVFIGTISLIMLIGTLKHLKDRNQKRA